MEGYGLKGSTHGSPSASVKSTLRALYALITVAGERKNPKQAPGHADVLIAARDREGSPVSSSGTWARLTRSPSNAR